ncbi:MAG: hypothetical protein U9R28_08635 [Pseudomonadota bacterium]|nr:hypothetical protein [Pseudomonadota bacterium]
MQSIHVFTIPKQHSCLVGHFPEHPIVPGVVLLEQIESTLSELLPHWGISELIQTKFIDVVLPDELMEIHLTSKPVEPNNVQQMNVSFKIIKNSNQKKVASGKFKLLKNQEP